jgi:hypothetical protein
MVTDCGRDSLHNLGWEPAGLARDLVRDDVRVFVGPLDVVQSTLSTLTDDVRDASNYAVC